MGYYDLINKRVQSLQYEVERIYQNALKYGHDHGMILERINERIYDSYAWGKLPRYAKDQVRGYMDAWRTRVWRECVLWAHRMPYPLEGGEMVDNWINPHQPRGHEVMSGHYDQIIESAHLWRAHWERGEIRFYTLPDKP